MIHCFDGRTARRGVAFFDQPTGASCAYPIDPAAADLAARLIRDARVLGVDPSRIVLAEHSAGAHLAALIGTDPYISRVQGSAWRS
ncbi:hypothetical protein [Sphingomonas sp. BT-65]|uniref:hypothetical protein n=1 Tax=Sphingomonas sp. BT-65 TaxID=2989821 RepID=UPI00278C09AF|nr:hypothetical protein [Sphingomonas sp. BT-65]